MMIGITGAWIFIKKRVYLCPAGAACPGSFNPDNTFLQDIRTVMQYWLHVGMLIVGVGLVKLVAYQAWSEMRQRGNTIDVLGLNIGTVNGSALNAVNLLFFRRRNRSLGMFVLTHVAIITAISLVVGKSISTVTDTGGVELLFDYPMNISILNVAYQDSSQGLGSFKYATTWAWLTNTLTNLTPLFNQTFSGTFIIQDSRAKYGVNAQPSGQQISGSVYCVDPSAIIFVNLTGFSNISRLNITYLPPNLMHNVSGSITLQFDPTNLVIGKLTGQYLPAVAKYAPNSTFIWFTITDGIIPNAMEIPQSTLNSSGWDMNSLFIGLCEHTVAFSNLPQNDVSGNGMQYINPSQPIVYLPPGEDIWELQSPWSPEIVLTQEDPVAICDDGCMRSGVWNILLAWWGLQDNLSQAALGIDIYCYGGVLSPTGGDTNQNQTCPSLDGEIWNRTLALVLDGMIQTYPRMGNASQKLFAQAESIGMWQWWLQGIIPLLAFILYIACLAYTVTVYWAGETMKELDLLEVINATHAEEERLTKSVMVGGDLKKRVGRLRK